MFVAIAFYSKISVTKMKQVCNAMLEDVRIQKLQNMDMMALEMERCNKFVNKTTYYFSWGWIHRRFFPEELHDFSF